MDAKLSAKLDELFQEKLNKAYQLGYDRGYKDGETKTTERYRKETFAEFYQDLVQEIHETELAKLISILKEHYNVK